MMNHSRFVPRVIACVALFVVLGPLPAHAQLLYTAGHGDIGLAYEADDDLFLHFHLGVGAVVGGTPLGGDAEFEPEDLATFVANPPDIRLAGASWDFLGIAAGEQYWRLPQSPNATRPFLGIATEELEFGDWTDVSFALTNVSGPGEFALWQGNSANTVVTDVFFASADGLDSSDVLAIPDLSIGGHDHYNWGFTAPGLYVN